MINRRRFISGIAMSLFTGAIPQWLQLEDHSGKLTNLSGQAFGTSWQLTLPSNSPLPAIIKTCQSSIQVVNAALSPWDVRSEISRFNTAETTDWFAVSQCCSDVIQSALHIAYKSDGYFDPTVGPIVGKMGFGPIHRSYATPDHTKIMARPHALRKMHPQLTLDPCGIAKGYALDLIVSELYAMGITNHFLEIGGEVRASGHHPSGREWRVGIESPLHSGAMPEHYVSIKDKALATSGVKHNSYRVDDKLLSHIVDPKSRQPMDNALLSVSVIADSAMLADGWATALLAAGGNKALPKAVELNIPALFMFKTKKNTVSTIAIAGFESYLTRMS